MPLSRLALPPSILGMYKCIPALCFAAIVLCGCAGPTPYQPQYEGAGYGQEQLADNRYRITYTANALTTRERMRQYLLYRAAEITLDSEHNRFILVEEDTGEGRLSGIKLADEGAHPYDFAHRHLWFGSPVVAEEHSTTTYEPYSRYTASAVVVTFSDGEPPIEGKVFDAREVIELLGPSVVRGR